LSLCYKTRPCIQPHNKFDRASTQHAGSSAESRTTGVVCNVACGLEWGVCSATSNLANRLDLSSGLFSGDKGISDLDVLGGNKDLRVGNIVNEDQVIAGNLDRHTIDIGLKMEILVGWRRMTSNH